MSEPLTMTNRCPPHPTDEALLAEEVDSLITTMGVDPSLLDLQQDGPSAATRAQARTATPPPSQAPTEDGPAWGSDIAVDPEVHAAEIALVEAHAKARLAAEVDRVKAEALAQKQAELAAQETAAIAERERAVTEARTQAEAAAREVMATQLARARAESEDQLAREIERSRKAMERQLADRMVQSRADAVQEREADLARARAEAESTRAAAVQEARAAAMQEARAAAEAAAGKALQAEMARVRSDTEGTLQAELANMREQVELARQSHAQAEQHAKAAREQAARDVQVAAQRAATKALEVEAARIRSEAQARLKEETARARQEATERLATEVAKLRAETDAVARQAAAAMARAEALAAAPAEPPPAQPVFRDRLVARHSGDDAGDGSATRVWMAASAVAAAVVIVGTTGYLLWGGQSQASTAQPAAPVAQVVDPLLEPPTSSRGRLLNRPPGPLAPRPANATPGAGAAAPAPGTTTAPVAGAGTGSPGLLKVFSRVPLELVVDGQRVGSTEDGQVTLAAGRRQIELVNSRLNYRGEVTLDITAGQVTSHTATLPPGQLRIAGAAGAEVWVEGEHVGTLPLGDISVPLGTREVLVRHPLFGERRQTVEVTYGSPRQITLMQDAGDDTAAAPASR